MIRGAKKAPHDPQKARHARAFSVVRPAWARSSGWKSLAELATVRQASRNCVRVTERGEEARSVNREPRYTNRIGGGAVRGEPATICEALVAKGQAT